MIETFSVIIFPIFAPAFGNVQFTMNNEHLSTAIIIYCPISSSLLALHSSFKTYTFASKERDEESGLSYFGARYYSSDLSIWLAVDPMSDKYPSLSPYVYCANNPVKLVDPNGEEVEFNSFSDRLIVAIAYLTNKCFRKQYSELKKSEEIYVFRQNITGDNDFTTDGDKLFINYSLTDKDKGQGQTIFSQIRHETEHAIEFEHGELGFMNVGDELNEKWVPVNYDISDEYNANNIQNSGSTTYWSNSSSIRSLWNSADETQRNHALEQVPAYEGLPMGPCDNLSKERIQNCSYYLRPHSPR